MATESYQADNIFAKIMAGDIPCHKVYEDAETLVFMDILPASRGHCLVLPKAPSRNLLDIDETALNATMMTVQKVAKAVIKSLNADGVTIRQNNEAAGGQEVFHTHFHIMPRYLGDTLRAHDGSEPNHEELAALAKQIGDAIE
ncbi:MAG: HIT family protein [Hyphomicrobiales bacterium]